MIFFELFKSFFQIGLFSFGGGYAALPLIKEQVMVVHDWMSLDEFADIITISQMTPGPIAINAATHVGIKMAGILGGMAATFSNILPCIIIASIVGYFFFKYRNLKIMQAIMKGLRPASVALIAAAGFSIVLLAFFGEKISIDSLDLVAVVIFAGALFLLRKYKLNPILTMLITGGVAACAYMLIDKIQ